MSFGGSGSSGALSSLAAPPSRAYGQPPKLCATNRRAPASRAAASRMSVPSVRRRLVAAKPRSRLRVSSAAIAVSWCTTTSGRAATTAAVTAVAVERVGHDGLGAELAQHRRLGLRARHAGHVVAGGDERGTSGGRWRSVAPARKIFT